MAFPYDSLTLDGRTLRGQALLDHVEMIGGDPAHDSWWRPLTGSLQELLHRDASTLAAHTSGTTGKPKPIAIPHADLIASAQLTAQVFDLHAGQRALLCLPTEYIAGKMMLIRALVLGLDLHISDPRGSVLDHLIDDQPFDFTAMVPVQIHRAILEDKARCERIFRRILLGGGPISNVLVEDLQNVRIPIIQGYGSTETVTHVALRTLNGPERSDHFTAIGDVSFAQDDRGCLVVRTPHLSTKEHFTNDLVEIQDKLHFTWLGRSDNVILSGGKKIFPEQLEARTAGVIPYAHFFTAFPEEKLGEAVLLVLETEEASDDVLEGVIHTLTTNLDQHELPRRVIAMRRFLRTAAGKVRRHETLMGLL